MVKKSTSVFVLLIIGMLNLSGCCEEPNAEQQYLQKLTFTWTLQQARVNGIDATPAFSGMTLTIKKSRIFTVTNAVEPFWRAKSSFRLWEIAGSPDYDILRDYDVWLHVSELSSSTLKLRMQWPPYERASAVDGNYEFLFTK